MSKTIYIVDDDEAVRDSLASLLEAHGYAAEAFSSAQGFLASFDEKPSVLLIDVNMPEMSGLELLAEVRSQWPRLPIIMMTGRTRTLREIGDRLPAGIELLAKPFPEDILVTAIEQASVPVN